MATKFWCKELLMIKPDPAPYLLAARRPRETRLLASLGHPLYYTNPARFEIDELSGKTLGQQEFELQFAVNSSAISQGTTYLIEAPGLLECKTQDNTLYFKFGWDATWYKVPSNCIATGWNTIILGSDGTIISLIVNQFYTVLVDSTVHWKPWEQPTFPQFGTSEYSTMYNSFLRNEVSQFPYKGTFTSANGTFTYDFSKNNYLNALYGMPWCLSDGYIADGDYYMGTPSTTILNHNFQGVGSPDGNYHPEIRTTFPFLWNFGKVLKIHSIKLYQMKTYAGFNYESMPMCSRSVTAYTDGTRVESLGSVSNMTLTPGSEYTITVNDKETSYLWLEMLGDENTYEQRYNATAGLSEIVIDADERVEGDVYPQISVGQILVQADWTKIRNVRAVLL